ncbi:MULTISPECIES: hypothetical protein [Thermomonospora]|uniref:hypothetical protein n=1 Tax=Thermomonospora TaxID=2019 RepID=UPI000309C177|nr:MULTISPECIES: hypothetical protein [Thermomonospora]
MRSRFPESLATTEAEQEERRPDAASVKNTLPTALLAGTPPAIPVIVRLGTSAGTAGSTSRAGPARKSAPPA